MARKIRIFIYFIIIGSLSSYAQLRTDTLHIAHYDIHLSILDFTNKKIEGNAVLHTCIKKEGVQTIRLDLLSLQVDSVKINGAVANFSHHDEALLLFLPSIPNIGDTLTLSVYYQGVPAKDATWGGFYFSGQYAYNMGVGFTAIPHNFGRVWYPCLDEFTDKSTYTFSIRTESSKMAVCGGVLSDTTHLSDNTVLWRWEVRAPIPTYLASVAVGNYQVYEDTYQGINGEIPIAIYAPPSYLGQVAGSFANLNAVLRIFETHYGPYQWDRVGYVLVNFSAGAMEHAMNIAYPQFAVNGNLMYESLLIHELSHAWFGNQITCRRAEEMWINEGFARYSEALAEGELYPNEDIYLDGYKTNIRRLQADVLRNAHIDDGGYYALANVPQQITYGTTSYDKGALIVHTLRHYLGDSLFFPAIQSLLEDYKFQSLSSEDLFVHLSASTGIDLTSFYEGWVNQPGFLHFSIDSIRPAGTHRHFVYVRQKRHQAPSFGNDNKIEITLFNQFGEKRTMLFEFSGEYGVAEMEFEGEPIFGVIDLYEKMSDAVIDYHHWFYQPGSYLVEEAAFVGNISQLDSAVWLRVEHHFVAPDTIKYPNPNIVKMSTSHYWRVEYVGGGNVNGTLSFRYKADTQTGLDRLLFEGGYNSADLLLLYRRDASQDWQIIPSTLQGTLSGIIKSTALRPGEYTLAIGDRSAIGVHAVPQKEKLELFPNPAKDSFTVSIPNHEQYSTYYLYNMEGKIVKYGKIVEYQTCISTSDLSRGNYFLKLLDSNNQQHIGQKVVLQ